MSRFGGKLNQLGDAINSQMGVAIAYSYNGAVLDFTHPNIQPAEKENLSQNTSKVISSRQLSPCLLERCESVSCEGGGRLIDIEEKSPVYN